MDDEDKNITDTDLDLVVQEVSDPKKKEPNGNGAEYVRRKLHSHEEKIDYLVRMRDIDHENTVGLRREVNLMERNVNMMRSDVGRLIVSHNTTQEEIKKSKNDFSDLMGELLTVAARLEKAKERDTLHDVTIQEHGKTIEQYKRDRTVIVIGWRVAAVLMGGMVTLSGFLLRFGPDIARLFGAN